MYNNFFISRVGFWRSANVQRFLRYVDQSGYIYSRRYGDLQLQSIAVQIYAKKERVHMFDDFTYQHGTTMKRSKYLEQQPQRQPAQPPPANASDECINFGGIAAGTNDTNGYQSVCQWCAAATFCRTPCLRVYLHNRRLVLAATAGQVKGRTARLPSDAAALPLLCFWSTRCRDDAGGHYYCTSDNHLAGEDFY